jgi:GGDEF domain-containing protein
MGLPIFGLILILISTTLVNNYRNLTLSFYIESTLLLLVSVYFIFYLIYRGFDVAITDSVSKVFTREYIYNYLKQKIQTNKTYTILLIGIDNIADINSSYGIKNGDKVLRVFSKWIGDFLNEKEIYNFPIGRIRAGDFIIGLEGNSYENKTLLDLLLLKSQEIKLQNIELKISGALVDTSISKNLDNIIDLLFEQKECEKCKDLEIINPEEKERLVIEAIKEKSISIASQKVFNKANNEVFGELFIRLKTKDNKFIHQKNI